METAQRRAVFRPHDLGDLVVVALVLALEESGRRLRAAFLALEMRARMAATSYFFPPRMPRRISRTAPGAVALIEDGEFAVAQIERRALRPRECAARSCGTWRRRDPWPDRPPPSCTTRSFISSAALLVKVMARIERASTPRSSSRAMRVVTTRVLPEPAPASTSMGPRSCSTASRCEGLRGWALRVGRYGHRGAGHLVPSLCPAGQLDFALRLVFAERDARAHQLAERFRLEIRVLSDEACNLHRAAPRGERRCPHLDGRQRFAGRVT